MKSLFTMAFRDLIRNKRRSMLSALGLGLGLALLLLMAAVVRGEMRDAMERVDREYARQGNLQKEHLQNERKNEAGNKRVIADVTVPILYPQTESAHAYLSGVFLTGHPIFSTVTSPENADAGNMMDAINELDVVR